MSLLDSTRVLWYRKEKNPDNEHSNIPKYFFKLHKIFINVHETAMTTHSWFHIAVGNAKGHCLSSKAEEEETLRKCQQRESGLGISCWRFSDRSGHHLESETYSWCVGWSIKSIKRLPLRICLLCDTCMCFIPPALGLRTSKHIPVKNGLLSNFLLSCALHRPC